MQETHAQLAEIYQLFYVVIPSGMVSRDIDKSIGEIIYYRGKPPEYQILDIPSWAFGGCI